MTVISADIRRGLSYAGVLFLADGGARIAATSGLIGPEWPTRATMAVLGAFLMVTGNAIPKTLAPLSAASCNLASLQRLQRQAGWMFSIAGAGLILGWLAFPEPVANLLTLLLAPITALVAIQTLRLRRRRMKENSVLSPVEEPFRAQLWTARSAATNEPEAESK